MKRWLENATGVLWGRYRWRDSSSHGPAPWLWLGVRPGGTSWTRLEAGIAGRGFYVTWGQR
jgi:hypothetical protein